MTAGSLCNQIDGFHVFIQFFRLRYSYCASVDGNAYYSQAKRKTHAQRDTEAIRQMHAVQIYAEMLGLVCHEELYKNDKGSQEVVLTLFLQLTVPRHLFSMPDMPHFLYTGQYS
jgi:hypothetical protein